MRSFLTALCAAALVVPLLSGAADAAERNGRGGGGTPQNVGPQGAPGPQGGRPGVGRGGGGFRGDGFRGGFRGRDRFRGGVFIGGFGPGWYDPLWGPYGPYYGYGYGYDYGYYPPPVAERDYGPPPADYLIPPDGPPPPQSWYHCRNPEGYYPYVRQCNDEWEAVPVTPPPDGPPPPRRGG